MAVAEVTTVLSDSQAPSASPADETQLPCSPSHLLNTDVALQTLLALDACDQTREQEARVLERNHWPHMHLLFNNVWHVPQMVFVLYVV